ncbi:MAG: hypothetical protein HQ568_08280 [Calditrichaeota bacterium]|nr:hypothetical protein [Calditrichota bacterium]
MEDIEKNSKSLISKLNIWILAACLLGILGLGIHKFVKTGEGPYIQLGIVYALSTTILKEIPTLAKRIDLYIFMLVVAVFCIGLEIYFAI